MTLFSRLLSFSFYMGIIAITGLHNYVGTICSHGCVLDLQVVVTVEGKATKLDVKYGAHHLVGISITHLHTFIP